MANKNIGSVTCPFCGGIAAMRAYSKGSRALYFYCANDGIIRPNLPHGQEWLKRNGTFYADESEEQGGEPENKAAAEPRNEATPAKPRNRGGIFGGIDL